MAAVIQRITTSAEPVTVGSVRLTAQASVWIVRLPFAAIVWNRPSAVLVERNGAVQRLPIYDPTRFAQLALLLIVAAVWRVDRRTLFRRKDGWHD